MPITPTNTRAIRVAVAKAIVGIVPKIVHEQARLWSYAQDQAPSGFRVFTLAFDPTTHEWDVGMRGGHVASLGLPCSVTMRVLAGYHGLSRTDAEDLICSDHMDLFLTLHPRTDSGAGVVDIDGVEQFLADGPPEAENNEQGHMIVAFPFALHYLREI